jgi:serine/threonine protein phosphatase PrpC
MIEVFTHSEAGGHDENQDAFDVRPHPLDPACYLCVVADGQGGRAGAAVAATLACRVVMGTASARPPSELLRPTLWLEMMCAVDQAVAEDLAAGFTTLVGFCISGGHLCGASSGDSAALLLGPNQPGNVLTSRQRKNPPVGSDATAFVSFAAEVASPWKVLAMTDGVWKYVGLQTVMELASERCGQDLILGLRERASLPRTGQLQDDFTVVLLQATETSLPSPGSPV